MATGNCLVCNAEFERKPRGRRLYCDIYCRRRSEGYKATARHYFSERRKNDPTWRAMCTAYQLKSKSKDIRRHLLNSAKNNSKNNGTELTITKEDIVIPDPPICPVFGVLMESHIGKGCFGTNSFSIDRIDNSKGYIPGNVRVISDRANRLKNNATVEEIEKILEYMKKG